MAKRKHKKYKRIDSAEVQGEGSFVVVKSPGFADMKGFDVSGAEDDEKKAVEMLLPLLGALVHDWDWVDDDDNPLPLPEADPDVINRLCFQEQLFLTKALDLADLKN